MFLGMKFIWFALLIARFLLVFIPQTGYLHPDEFFQGPEITAGDIFNLSVRSSWEFNRDSPIRSVASTVPASGLAFVLLRTLHDQFKYITITPYLLLVTPRLVMSIASLVYDWCLYRLCTLKEEDPYASLIVFSSSYVCLVYYTRTFSNSVESVLFSILLCTVGCDLMLSSKKIKKNVDRDALNYSEMIGTIITCGIFVRPTFVLFSFWPLLFWIISKSTSSNQVWNFLRIVNRLLISSLPTAAVLILFDTLYYRGRAHFSSVMEYDIQSIVENAVITPLNFCRYNLQAANLKQHGVHPRMLHFAVNIPLLYGILGIVGIVSCLKIMSQCIYKRQWISIDPLYLMMMGSWVLPVVFLSIFPHQEPRFLIPVLFPLVFLHANFIFKHVPLLIGWFVMNILLLLFFGFVHQAGVVPCLMHLSSIISPNANLRTNIVFYHSYMPPTHLLHIQKDQKITVSDLQGAEPYALILTLNNLTPTSSRKVLLIAPACMEESLQSAIGNKFKLERLQSFFPHFSSEVLPKNLAELSTTVKLREQFSLQLFRVHLMHD